MVENNAPRSAITCNGCAAQWTGLAVAHCAAEKTVVIPLAVDRDGPGLFADPDTGRAGQRLRIAAVQLADLVSDEAGAVRTGRLPKPDAPVYQSELNGSDWTTVCWSIAGPAPVAITDYIIEQSRTNGDRLLAGFEVETPSRQVLRLMLDLAKTDHRGRRKPADPWTIRVTTACHRTFASVGLFDHHRVVTDNDGRCIKPSDVVCRSGPNEGQRLIFFRDGMWRGRELTPIERARLQRGKNREVAADDH